MDLAFGPEWRLLEVLCAADPSAELPAEVPILLQTEGFRYGELIEQGARHKILPLVAHALTRPPVASTLPYFIRRHLHVTRDVNRHAIARFRVEAARVVDAVAARGAPIVATKGMSFESTAWGGLGARFMNDADFMVASAHHAEVNAALDELGFVVGRYSLDTERVEPFDRRQMVGYRLSPDHIPARAKAIDDGVLHAVHVDVASSLTWTNAPWQVPIEDALASPITVPLPGLDRGIPAMAPCYGLLFTVLHFFREAWFDKWLSFEQDVNLSKFADILRFVAHHGPRGDLTNFAEVVRVSDTGRPVGWVLTHLDRVFATNISAELGIPHETDEAWLASARGPDGEARAFRGSMRERLVSRNRRALFTPTVDPS